MAHPQPAANPKDQVVLCEEIGQVRLITLNRPNQLNAISSEMVSLLAVLLEKCEKDYEANLMIIKGAGRAFSAGGDLRMFYEGKASRDSCLEVAYRMHWLCYHIHTYKKTLVALVSGLAIGGGASLMVPMTFSVVTEKAVFSIPETGIGFHADCGFSYMLSRLPGHMGEFLALTGTKLTGMELVAVGLASHFISSEKLTELEKHLIKLNSGNEKVVKSAIEEFSTDIHLDEDSILNKQLIIDECFSKETIEDIIKSLQEVEARKGEDAWSGRTMKALKKSSPTSLKIMLKSIREGRKQTLIESLQREFRLSLNIFRATISSDLYEGVRALIIEKDNAPKWDPPTCEGVDAASVNLVFQPLMEDFELRIPQAEDERWDCKYENSPYATRNEARIAK